MARVSLASTHAGGAALIRWHQRVCLWFRCNAPGSVLSWEQPGTWVMGIDPCLQLPAGSAASSLAPDHNPFLHLSLCKLKSCCVRTASFSSEFKWKSQFNAVSFSDEGIAKDCGRSRGSHTSCAYCPSGEKNTQDFFCTYLLIKKVRDELFIFMDLFECKSFKRQTTEALWSCIVW